MRCARANCASVGLKAALITGICFGWIDALPVKPISADAAANLATNLGQVYAASSKTGGGPEPAGPGPFPEGELVVDMPPMKGSRSVRSRRDGR